MSTERSRTQPNSTKWAKPSETRIGLQELAALRLSTGAQDEVDGERGIGAGDLGGAIRSHGRALNGARECVRDELDAVPTREIDLMFVGRHAIHAAPVGEVDTLGAEARRPGDAIDGSIAATDDGDPLAGE